MNSKDNPENLARSGGLKAEPPQRNKGGVFDLICVTPQNPFPTAQ